METVGEFFRQVRETKGLTLDDVASKTRIHPEFLKALEEGNFAKLPEQVFARGFVRSYARSLGLDEEDAVHRFEESAGAFYGKQIELERLRVQQVEDERRKKANRKVVVAAVGVGMLALVLLLAREQSTVVSKRPMVEPEQFRGAATRPPVRTAPSPAAREEPQSPVARQATEQAAQPRQEGASALSDQPPAVQPLSPPQPVDPAPAPVERQEPVPIASAPSEPLAGLAPVGASSRPAPLLLDLEALQLTWVVVQVDGASPHEALLRPGERVRWKASDQFTLTLGNAGGVRVELNGKPQGPFGPSGRVARDIVLKR